ncbi:MAG: hypothetical protein JRI67_09080 [Deltaproteobacteria bacterium]|nr:hypothetical protein [Deltaproteobacteria bacterium]
MKQLLPLSVVVVQIIFLVLSPAFSQEKNEIDLSQILKEVEKKSFSIGGFLEFQPSLVGLDRDSVFYKLKFPDQGPNTTSQYNFGLRLEGRYEKRAVGLHFTADSLLKRDLQGWDNRISLFEGYLSWRLGPRFTLDAGKKTTKWGKGYAWNPVAFIDRPKNPEDPLEALEGFYVLSADITRSFGGPLKTLALTPVLVPVTKDINSSFGKHNHLNFGGKLYFLLWDSDIDFLFLTGASRSNRFGFDLSRNLKSNLEVHAEWAWLTDSVKTEFDQDGQVFTTVSDVTKMLLGLRYLTASETTFIVDYYHNGSGFEQQEYEDIIMREENPVPAPPNMTVNRSNPSLLPLLGTPNPMRNYLYFRTSQKEPFDILYLTPELTSIFNLDDGSFQLMPGTTYSPQTNLQMRLRGIFMVGNEFTEFGEKQADYRIEFRVRYFF